MFKKRKRAILDKNILKNHIFSLKKVNKEVYSESSKKEIVKEGRTALSLFSCNR